MKAGTTPRARKDGLVVRDLGDELVVYDLETHEAHCLNPSAAEVFSRCDGRTSVREIADHLASELGACANEEWVRLALDALGAAHLLEAPSSPSPPGAAPPLPSVRRRELLRRVGAGAALLVPAVVSMVAPTPAEAANTCIQEVACTSVPQPCWVTDPGTDCQDCTCDGVGSCGPPC